MPRLLRLLLGSLRRLFSSRRNLWLENLALRQQLMAFQRHGSRPKIGRLVSVHFAAHYDSSGKGLLVVVTHSCGTAALFAVARNAGGNYARGECLSVYVTERGS